MNEEDTKLWNVLNTICKVVGGTPLQTMSSWDCILVINNNMAKSLFSAETPFHLGNKILKYLKEEVSTYENGIKFIQDNIECLRYWIPNFRFDIR